MQCSRRRVKVAVVHRQLLTGQHFSVRRQRPGGAPSPPLAVEWYPAAGQSRRQRAASDVRASLRRTGQPRSVRWDCSTGKKGLITGVFNKQSIAWAIAERIMDEGGECGFSYMPDKPDDERQKNLGRIQKLTEGNAAGEVPAADGRDQRRADRRASWRGARRSSASSTSCSTRSPSPRRTTCGATRSPPAARGSSWRWRSAPTA